jgi:hypothetical protein
MVEGILADEMSKVLFKKADEEDSSWVEGRIDFPINAD